MCKIKSELNHENKTDCVWLCVQSTEVVPYLPHLGKLTCGLFHAALATKQR